MSAISYSILPGGTLETVVAATNAPSVTGVELRFDTTATTVTDASVGGTRAMHVEEIRQAMRILEQYLLRDTNPPWP